MKFREPESSIKILEEGIALTQKSGHSAINSIILSNRSILHTLRGEPDKARECLLQAEKLVEKIKVAKPFYGTYLMAKAHYELALLRSSGNQKNISWKAVNQTLTELVKTAKKFAGFLPEALLFKALAYLHINKERRALKFIQDAMQTAETNGAKVDLSRIYFELGKYLSDPKTKQKQLNGLSGKDYIEKARAMFEEMDLQWDLEEYGKYI
ncbi:MAG: hypothetical protein KAT48_00875 [Bacteroidales bacterium]|nr:hypothetical protein [Bacteroidales bacterium]